MQSYVGLLDPDSGSLALQRITCWASYAQLLRSRGILCLTGLEVVADEALEAPVARARNVPFAMTAAALLQAFANGDDTASLTSITDYLYDLLCYVHFLNRACSESAPAAFFPVAYGAWSTSQEPPEEWATLPRDLGTVASSSDAESTVGSTPASGAGADMGAPTPTSIPAGQTDAGPQPLRESPVAPSSVVSLSGDCTPAAPIHPLASPDGTAILLAHAAGKHVPPFAEAQHLTSRLLMRALRIEVAYEWLRLYADGEPSASDVMTNSASLLKGEREACSGFVKRLVGALRAVIVPNDTSPAGMAPGSAAYDSLLQAATECQAKMPAGWSVQFVQVAPSAGSGGKGGRFLSPWLAFVLLGWAARARGWLAGLSGLSASGTGDTSRPVPVALAPLDRRRLHEYLHAVRAYAVSDGSPQGCWRHLFIGLWEAVRATSVPFALGSSRLSRGSSWVAALAAWGEGAPSAYVKVMQDSMDNVSPETYWAALRASSSLPAPDTVVSGLLQPWAAGGLLSRTANAVVAQPEACGVELGDKGVIWDDVLRLPKTGGAAARAGGAKSAPATKAGGGGTSPSA